MADAYRDQNFIPTLIASSNVDGKTPVRVYADPTTHRLLIDSAGSGLTEITATGTVDGNNLIFVFSSSPTYVVSDGVWYKATDNNAGTQWTDNGSGTVTMVVPPSFSIYGF